MPVALVGRIRDCHMVVDEAVEAGVAHYLFSRDQQGRMDLHCL